MLHAPYVVPITTAKLDISMLLGPSPSPPPPSSQAPPGLRSISVPTSTALYPLITSPSPSTASQVSTATAPASLYPQPDRRAHAPTAPPPAANKRPPPSNPHPSASPAKKQSKWTAQEDAEIIHLRGMGMKWDEISKRLPGRSSISCRLHYQNYLEKKSEWDEEKKNKLARVYDRFKAKMWGYVAQELGVPWRAAEAMHWHLGEHDIARRAGGTPFMVQAASGPPPSSHVALSAVTASSGASIHSPGGTMSSARGRGGLGGLPGGELPSIQPGFARSGESGRRDDRSRRSGVEGGRGRRPTVLPSVTELEKGVRVYDEEEDEEEEEEEEEEEDEEEGEDDRRRRREG